MSKRKIKKYFKKRYIVAIIKLNITVCKADIEESWQKLVATYNSRQQVSGGSL